MNIDIIIDKIELAYGHYIQQGSEIMFNTFTDHFFDKLDSMPSCKLILEDLESQHKIDQKVFEERIISVTMFAVGNTNEPIGDSPYAVKCSAP